MIYKLYKNLDGTTYNNGVIRTSDNAVIPFDPANTDYQQFLKDIKEGVELLDADGNVVTDFVPQES